MFRVMFIPAAFRRLCVETKHANNQPTRRCAAAFRRLCVETLSLLGFSAHDEQPPSGGCVLKRQYGRYRKPRRTPAAFRRLCVETNLNQMNFAKYRQPPSGGCVLKPFIVGFGLVLWLQPPSGGCVLKHHLLKYRDKSSYSRLQAAVC